MQRRKFLMQGFAAGAASLVSPFLLAAEKNNVTANAGIIPFKVNYDFHDGMFKNSAGDDFIEQIKFGHSMGFRSIEDNGMMRRTPEQQEKIGKTLATLGMKMGVFVIDGGDNWKTSLATGKQEFKDVFLKTCKEAVNVAKRCNAKWMTVVPGFFDRSLPLDLQTANIIDALRKGAAILEPHGLIMVMDPQA